jgi:hypothetical protein
MKNELWESQKIRLVQAKARYKSSEFRIFIFRGLTVFSLVCTGIY